jgi:hypothetical protein
MRILMFDHTPDTGGLKKQAETTEQQQQSGNDAQR